MAYEKHEWYGGEVITSEKLNHIENGIDDLDKSTTNLINNLNSEIQTITTETTTLKSRVDQIVAPTGESPNPSEITDARVGADGTTYDSLGNAIRTQVTDLKSQIQTEVFRATKTLAVSDFNNYLTNGAYLVNSGSLANRPDTTEQGTLLVFAYNTTGNYGYAQIYVTNSSYRMFYRVYVGGTWKNWVEISSTTMLSDATDKAFTERAIATADFNNYTKNGAYLVNSSMANAPYTSANGLLCVMTWNSTNAYGMMQMFIPSSQNISPYYRYRWNSVWSAWSEFSNGVDLDVIHIPSGNNVLDPENFTLAGFISTQDGTTFTSNQSYMCTNDYIDVPFGSTDIYAVFPQTENNDRVCCFLFYDSLNNYVGSYSGRLSGLNYKRYEVGGKIDVAKIKFWVNKTSVSGGSNDICISFATVTTYEQYTEIGGVRNASLETPSIYMPFAGKTIVNFGDSIFGNKRAPWSVSYALEKNTGAKVYNMGFGGTDMAARSSAAWDAFSMYRLAYAIANNDFSLQDTAIQDTSAGLLSYFEKSLAILKTIDFSEVDIITIAFGTNDFTGNIVLDNANNPVDTSTFCGALRYSLQQILTAFPHIRIYVCGQTYRFWLNGTTFVDDSDTHENGNGDKLTDFVRATLETANEYHIPFIDNYAIGITKENRGYYFPEGDGTHQNYLGAKLIADHIKHEIF